MDASQEADSGESLPPLSLLVEPPSGECLQIPVKRSPFVIGRLNDCDLTLADKRISRRHARLLLEPGGFAIEDLGSRHGTVVNGESVRHSRLAVGDRIGFGIEGSYVITVCEARSPQTRLLKQVSEIGAGPRRTGALGRLSAVLDVARTMELASGVEEVFEAVVEAALSIARADRAFLLLRDASGRLEVKVARHAAGEHGGPAQLELPIARIADALERRSDLFAMSVDLAQDSGSAGDARRAALCIPILRMRIGLDHETSVISAKDDTLGVLYMEAANPELRLAEGNQALLHALAIEISTSVENARLIEEERQKRRLEHELDMARGIQRSLLPGTLPSEGWLVAKGHSEASSQLGGDYYDLMQVAPGRWAAVLADVSGKGASASILASLLQGAFFLGSGPDVSLSGTLRRINRYLCERSDRARFATVFAATIAEDATMRWSSAGHCPAILVRPSGRCELLSPTSQPIGLFEDAEFPESVCRLEPGDKLVMYSDGVTELRNSRSELYGEPRLIEAVSQLADLDTGDFFEALLARVAEFGRDASREDDLTVLVLGFRGSLGP